MRRLDNLTPEQLQHIVWLLMTVWFALGAVLRYIGSPLAQAAWAGAALFAGVMYAMGRVIRSQRGL